MSERHSHNICTGCVNSYRVLQSVGSVARKGWFADAPTLTMPKHLSLCPSECSSHVFSSPGAHHPPQPDAHLPPPPCQFEPDHLCSTSTMRSRAQSLISHPHHISLSTTACVPPPPHALEPHRSSPTPTMSVRAGTLSSCLHHINLCPTAHLPPPSSIQVPPLVSHLHHVLSSLIAHLLPPPAPQAQSPASLQPHPFKPNHSSHAQPCQFKPNCLCPTSTMSSRARQLISHLHQAPPRAQSLVSHPNCVHSIATACLPLAVSIQAQLLISHPTTLQSVMKLVKPLTQQCCHHRNDVGDTTMTVMVLRWRK